MKVTPTPNRCSRPQLHGRTQACAIHLPDVTSYEHNLRMQLTPVDGDPCQVALAGEEGVGVELGVAVDLLLVGDDRVDLGAVDLVTRACGGWAYEGGGNRSGKGSRRRIRDGHGSLPQLGRGGRDIGVWGPAGTRHTGWRRALPNHACNTGELTHDGGGGGAAAVQQAAAINLVVACRHGAHEAGRPGTIRNGLASGWGRPHA